MQTLLFALSGAAILLASGTFMRLSPLANSLFMVFFLFGMLLLAVYQKNQGKPALGRYQLMGLSLVSIILLLLLIHILPHVKPIVVVAIVLSILSVSLLFLIPASPHQERIWTALSWTWFSFFILYLAFELSPFGWWFLDQYSRAVSFRVGNYFDLPLRLGFTAMGVSGLVLCLVFVWATIFTLKGHWKLGLAVTIALTAVNHFGGVVTAWLGQWMSKTEAGKVLAPPWIAASLDYRYTALNFIPLIFLLECLVLFFLFERPLKHKIKQENELNQEAESQAHRTWITSNKHGFLQLAAACVVWAVMVAIAYMAPQWPTGSCHGRIILYQSLMSSWEKPNFEQLGPNSQPGLFSTLPDYLRACGFEVTLTRSISASVLKGADVFVVINFVDRWSEADRALLSRFIHRGGTLMVFADHTNVGHLMEESNKLLADTPIRVNGDSAHYLDNSWKNAFTMRLSSANRRNWDVDGVGLLVGASLSLLNSRAVPMLLGRYGFSDEANHNDPERRFFLGNRIYDIHEPLGDILLEASFSLGRGKVFVCGDTSALQPNLLALAHTRMADLFRWAVHGKVRNFPWSILLLVGLIVTLAIAVKKSHSPCMPMLRMPVLLTITVAITVAGADWLLARCYREPEYRGRIAYVDYSHISFIDHRGYWGDLGDTSLIINLIRNGYLPLIFKEFNSKALQASTLMVSMASTKPYSSKERADIAAFLSSGGHILIASSDRCSQATQAFLAEYGIKISNIPLGGVSAKNTSEKITMYNANPLIMEGLKPNETLCAAYGKYPVVVERKAGHGRLTVIADYGFLSNGRLEENNLANQANIFFLRKLIGE